MGFAFDSIARLYLFGLDPLGRAVTATFDAASRQIGRLDARGVLVSFAYDPVDRLIGKQYNNGDPAVTFAFDAVGNRTQMQDGTGTTGFSYDAVNQTLAVANPGGKTVSYGYDGIGQRRYMITPDGELFTYTFDPAQRLANLVNPQGDATTFQYDSADRRTGVSLANGTSVSLAYDNADRLLEITSLNSLGNVLIGSSYTYDNSVNRTGMYEVRQGAPNGIVTWSYDPTYQLIQEQRSGTLTYDIAHSYDPAGNRLVQTSSGAATTFQYDAANQLQTSTAAAGTTTFQSDQAGNLQLTTTPTGAVTTNTWDGENRLTAVNAPGVSDANAFNGDGLRVQIQDSTGTRNIIWDGQAYLLETTASGVTTAVYTQEPTQFGSLISERRNS
jgi:YD repeat-containing protein